MSTGKDKRRRYERGAGLELPPSFWKRWFERIQHADVLVRVTICAIAAICLWGVTQGWAPPFSYRTGYVPDRQLVARVEFAVDDPEATQRAREEARQEVAVVYNHDPKPIEQLQQALFDKVFQVIGAGSYDKVDKTAWAEFYPVDESGKPAADVEQRQLEFVTFLESLSADKDLTRLKEAVARTFFEYEKSGLLVTLQHDLDQGNQSEITVYPQGNRSNARQVEVALVRVGEIRGRLRAKLLEELVATNLAGMNEEAVELVGNRLFTWLILQLEQGKGTTLTFNREATEARKREAAAAVATVQRKYQPGEKFEGMEGGEPLEDKHIELLRKEHEAVVENLSVAEMAAYSAANFGMYLALYTLCGFYIVRREPWLLADLRQLIVLLAFVVVTVSLVWLTAHPEWRIELIPILLFGLALAIAYRIELALLISGAVALISALSLGLGESEFVILLASMAGAIIFTGRVRSRTKLIYVGALVGVIAAFTTLGVYTLSGQMSLSTLLIHATWNGGCAVLAGILVTGLLPFIEQLFDVQTEISLLELGDAAHPLLQELVRRAPGTYNHSINVASIGEAAAEAIGANGLLLRVAAYFHDIGKMLKPAYFIENQGQTGNRHESLLPAMSTLVIIAHVKDGADLARQHRLPKRIIDFIEQHHGTTLVEYFYREASRRSEQADDSSTVDENNFRYPGPKPQTKEAGVMMLADCVESASRTLTEPTHSRIESLVRDMAMKRLLDGQFDECGLTLQELQIIEESLIKSLTAVYHGRVKYPDQETA